MQTLYYRYRPFSELSIKELLYNEIYFASSSECNDPYDSKTFYEFSANEKYWKNLISVLVGKISNASFSEAEISKIANGIATLCPMAYDTAVDLDITRICFEATHNIELSKFTAGCFKQFLNLYKPGNNYFASFSKSETEPLMWSHYASNHQGYCLIFKPINGKLNQCPPLRKGSVNRETPNGIAKNSGLVISDTFAFQNIEYKKDVEPLCAFHKLPAAVVGNKLEEKERVKLATSQASQFLHKHQSWEYEKEVRLSINTGASWLFGQQIELTSFERLIHFEPTQLVGIIFGARMPSENKKRLMEILLYRQEMIYMSSEYEKTIFNFAIFDARLSNRKRDITCEESGLISASSYINNSDEKYKELYKRWQEGWGMTVGKKERGSSIVQILG